LAILISSEMRLVSPGVVSVAEPSRRKRSVCLNILPHLKIYLSADSLPHEKNYLKRWTMTSSTPGATLGERGVEDGAKHGDKERVE
jgi:hypothetical protein